MDMNLFRLRDRALRRDRAGNRRASRFIENRSIAGVPLLWWLVLKILEKWGGYRKFTEQKALPGLIYSASTLPFPSSGISTTAL